MARAHQFTGKVEFYQKFFHFFFFFVCTLFVDMCAMKAKIAMRNVFWKKWRSKNKKKSIFELCLRIPVPWWILVCTTHLTRFQSMVGYKFPFHHFSSPQCFPFVFLSLNYVLSEASPRAPIRTLHRSSKSRTSFQFMRK